MAELSASMARRTITATVTGLSEEHTVGRTYHWYLDGTLVWSESTMAVETSRTYTFSGFPYVAQHTVLLQINNYADETELATLETTVDDILRLWSWSDSNGDATSEQTQAAYIAAANQGQTADFGYLVWNDLVNTLVNALTVWNGGYANYDDTLMAESYDPLTAARFNAVVQNIGNPLMCWAYKSASTGYLGRLEVHGYEEYGVEADTVYGAYLIELAKMLNVLIDAVGEMDAGYAALLGGHKNAVSLYTDPYLSLRAPTSRHLSFDGTLYTHQNLEFTAPAGRNLVALGGRVSVTESLTMIAPSLRFARHTGSLSGIAWEYAKMISRPPVKMVYAATESLDPGISAVMINRPPVKMQRTATETLTSALDGTLELSGAEWIDHTVGVTVGTTLDATLGVSATKDMAITATEKTAPTVELSAPDSIPQTMSDASVTSFAATLDVILADEWVIRDGTNLYIRTAWSHYQDQSELKVDTD